MDLCNGFGAIVRPASDATECPGCPACAEPPSTNPVIEYDPRRGYLHRDGIWRDCQGRLLSPQPATSTTRRAA